MRSPGTTGSRQALVALLLMAAVAAAAWTQSDPSKPVWRLMWANDEFLGSDNQFTNGFSLLKHSTLASTLAETSGTLAFGKRLAAHVLPQREGLYYREAWGIGQNMQTPDKLAKRDVILTDLPYVGMLGWINSYIAFDNRSFTGFQTLIGMVGSVTAAEEAQSTVHNITGASDPKGWDNQLANEPLLNVYLMKKYKFFNSRGFDATIDVDGGLGNFFSFGQTALELRFGRRPGGFMLMPLPLGHVVDYDARIRSPGATYFYGSLMARATGFLYAMPRDGNLLRNNNTWTENNVLDPHDFIGKLLIGLHVERAHWGVHLDLVFTTKSVRNPEQTTLADRGNDYGALVFEWQFQ